MKTSLSVIFLTLFLLIPPGNPAYGLTLAERCEAGKRQEAGKYAACRLKAEGKLVGSGDVDRYNSALSRCAAKLTSRFESLEESGACPTVGDGSAVIDFVSSCADQVVDSTQAGGTVPSCGDAAINLAGEECDAAALGGRTCAAIGFDAGTLACGVDCRFDTTGCTSEPDACGNGAVDAGEDCDLANLGGGTCSGEAFAGGTLACAGGCTYDTSGCYAERYVDNGDGSITDRQLNVAWESKIELDTVADIGDVHDADNTYRWAGACSVGGALCQPTAASAAACQRHAVRDKTGCATCAAGTCVVGGSGVTAWEAIVGLNAAEFAGSRDWRLPTLVELSAILDHSSTTAPHFMNTSFYGASCGAGCSDVESLSCACTGPHPYWSGETAGPSAATAYVISFADFGEGYSGKLGDERLRAVRSLRFLDGGNGTISDAVTGLVWEKKVRYDDTMDYTNLHDADNVYQWAGECLPGHEYCQPNAAAEALCLENVEGDSLGCAQCPSGTCFTDDQNATVWSLAAQLNAESFGGFDDWRVPTRAEHATRQDLDDPEPPLVDRAFHGEACGSGCADLASPACSCTLSRYWTSTTTAAIVDYAYVAYDDDSGFSSEGKQGDAADVRLVRGGR